GDRGQRARRDERPRRAARRGRREPAQGEPPRRRDRTQVAVRARHGAQAAMTRGAWLVVAAALLVACAGGPPEPGWKPAARDAAERGIDAYLSGDSRVAAAEFARARAEVTRTGRADLVARI